VVDVVRVTASDDEGNVTFDNDDATVTLRDVPSSIEVTKTPAWPPCRRTEAR
jgi:hypothetical protein